MFRKQVKLRENDQLETTEIQDSKTKKSSIFKHSKENVTPKTSLSS